MSIVSIRGAITVNKNDKEEILNNTKELLEEIIKKNNINYQDIISIFFTATKDLDKEYPAKSARELGLLECSLLCFQEMYVQDSLTKCIRVLIMLNSDKEQSQMNHVYLKGAKYLRKDLLK